ncbi:hypothetical protein O3684_08565 [Pauljensenia sp. 20925_1_27]
MHAINFLNRNPNASKILRLLDDDNIVVELNSVVKAKEYFSKELVVATIRKYLTKSHKREMSDSTSWFCVIIVSALLYVTLVKIVDYLVDNYEGEGGELSIAVKMYILLLLGASVALLLVALIAVFKCIKFQLYEFRSAQLVDRFKLSQVSLDRLCEAVSPQVEYAFIDATISKASRMVQVGLGSDDLKLQSYIPQWLWDDRCESEFRLSFRYDYGAEVTKYVQIMAERRFGASRDVICFVYSEYGIAAAQVVAALEQIGISAHYIGQLSGRLSQVRRVVMEMKILRECGLL